MGVARALFALKIHRANGTTDSFEDVEEFVSGFKYLYVRTRTATLSYHHDEIVTAVRRMSATSPWLQIHLRHPAPKERRQAN